jgi:hypothetical protein
MNNFIEDDNFLKEHQKDFINNVVLSSNFPYFYYPFSVNGDGNSHLTHIVKNRPENNGQWNSIYKDQFIDIFETFCKKNNITYKEIFRCAVNISFNVKDKKSPIHYDHEFKHRQIIIYLNNPLDNNSNTVILDKEKINIIKEIKPKKYKAICFDNLPHFMYYPQKGERFALIYTFI